jgi:hypothetical protein
LALVSPISLKKFFSSANKPLARLHRGLTRIGWVFGCLVGIGFCISAYTSISELSDKIEIEYSLKPDSDRIKANSDKVKEALKDSSVSSIDDLWTLFNDWQIQAIVNKHSGKKSELKNEPSLPEPRSPRKEKDDAFNEFARVFLGKYPVEVSVQELAQAVGNYEACLDSTSTLYRCARYSQKRVERYENSLIWAYFGVIWIPICTLVGWFSGWSIWFLISGFGRLPEP